LSPEELVARKLDKPLPGTKTTLKTVQSHAPVPMTEHMYHDLTNYMKLEGLTHPREFLFQTEVGTPLDPDHYLDRILKPLAKEAGIEGKVDHRSLRRSCATNFGIVNKGQLKDEQRLMRHTDAATTLNNYEQPIEESLRLAVTKWEGVLRKVPND